MNYLFGFLRSGDMGYDDSHGAGVERAPNQVVADAGRPGDRHCARELGGGAHGGQILHAGLAVLEVKVVKTETGSAEDLSGGNAAKGDAACSYTDLASLQGASDGIHPGADDGSGVRGCHNYLQTWR